MLTPRSHGSPVSHAPQDGAPCTAQSYIMAYFSLACTLWSSAIAYTLHATVIRGQHLHDVARRMPIIILVCQGVPLAMCVVCDLTDAFGAVGAWCWIRFNTSTGRLMQLVACYIPCWLCIAYNICVYISVHLRLRAIFGEVAFWVQATHTPSKAPDPPMSTNRSNSYWISRQDFEAESDSFSSFGSFASGAGPGSSYVELTDAPQSYDKKGISVVQEGPLFGRSYSVSTQHDKLRKLTRRLMMYPLIQVVVRALCFACEVSLHIDHVPACSAGHCRQRTRCIASSAKASPSSGFRWSKLCSLRCRCVTARRPVMSDILSRDVCSRG